MSVRRSLLKSIIFAFSFVTLFLGIATVSRGETKEEGMYFSILGVENYIEGDFDGTVNGGFLGSTVLTRIPKIESGRGFGILIGGYKGKLAGELYYSCSNHDTTFKYSDYNGNGSEDPGEDVIYSGEGDCQVIGGNIKYYFIDCFNRNLRFFGQFGLFIPKIKIEQGAYRLNNFYETANVNFTGYGGDLGLGILIHLHPNLAINGAAVYRGIRIKEVTAFDEDRVPSKSMYGNGRSYSIGLNYYF